MKIHKAELVVWASAGLRIGDKPPDHRGFPAEIEEENEGIEPKPAAFHKVRAAVLILCLWFA